MSIPFPAAIDIMDEYDDGYSYFTDEELAETPNERMARMKKAQETAKGHCKKCGKHFGKGVNLHERACKA